LEIVACNLLAKVHLPV